MGPDFGCPILRGLGSWLIYYCTVNFSIYFQNDIKEIHTAAIYGEVDSIDHKEYRQQIYSAKDINGISGLHKVA